MPQIFQLILLELVNRLKNLILIHPTAAASGLWSRNGTEMQKVLHVLDLIVSAVWIETWVCDRSMYNADSKLAYTIAHTTATCATSSSLPNYMDNSSLTSPIICERINKIKIKPWPQIDAQLENRNTKLNHLRFHPWVVCSLLSVPPVIRLGTSLLGSGQLVPTNTLPCCTLL